MASYKSFAKNLKRNCQCLQRLPWEGFDRNFFSFSFGVNGKLLVGPSRPYLGRTYSGTFFI